MKYETPQIKDFGSIADNTFSRDPDDPIAGGIHPSYHWLSGEREE